MSSLPSLVLVTYEVIIHDFETVIDLIIHTILDKSLNDLSVSERYDQRLELVKPKLEAFF
ncbi:hypothetical protein APE02nite_22440 [Alkalibacterium pelagium]|nr:hypothetical protein APE02nite_22440 [Alkalibacterium pelagium]